MYDLTSEEVLNIVQNTSKKELATLNLFDLTLVNEEALQSTGGVYLFYSLDNTCLYVGKATSRSFISRIASHFDPNPDAWFATFPNKVLKHQLTTDYTSALKFCRSCSLLLLKFNCDRESRKYAKTIETYLRDLLKPTLNSLKHSKNLPLQQKLKEHLKSKFPEE